MESNKFIKKYIDLYLNLHERNLPTINYQQYQNKMENFISNFPEIKLGLSPENESNSSLNLVDIVNLNYRIVMNYMQNHPFILHNMADFLNIINLDLIIEKAKEIQIHLHEITRIIQPESSINFQEKKRIYLGILWFLIGYYICYIIHKIERFEYFPNLLDASQNKFIIFVTGCFIFYDDILDLANINKNDKKWCLQFTDYFFQTILELSSNQKIEMLEIESNFLAKTTVKTANQNLRERTFRLLDVCLQERNKYISTDKEYKDEEKYRIVDKKVRLIFELFKLEVEISKNQKKKLKREKILVNLLTKSQKSIEVILMCLIPNLKLKESVLDLTYKFSFVSQLLDDLNDIEDDSAEGNITIFQDHSYLNYQQDIENTLKYLFYIQDDLKSVNMHDKNEKLLKISNHLANMLVFNYAVGKNNNIKLDTRLERFKFIRDADIIKFRVRKLEFQKNLGNFSFK